jgi:photosystem II stability/assembly factor-like uncharacterized protein
MSTSGGATWTQIDATMDDGYAVACTQNVILQGGCWIDTAGGNSKPAVFRSTNDGSTWQRTTLHTERGQIHTMAVAPTTPGIVYAGGYTYNTSGISHSRLYKTTNAGIQWALVGTSTFVNDYETLEAVIVDPSNANRVLAGTSRGVYVSTDGGGSWTPPSQTLYVYSLVAAAGKFYVGIPGGIWQSTNGGTSWTVFNNGLPAVQVLTLAYDAVGSRLYAGTNGRGVYRVQVATDVRDEEHLLPASMSLAQNFPNPFNPTTAVSFQLSAASNTRIEIYDMLGREIAVLVNARMNPGRYTVSWNASGFPSGVYVCRLKAGEYREARKMILAK